MAKSYPPSSPGARRNGPPSPDLTASTERAIVASILESPADSLALPALRWLCANAPRSFSDPLCGLAAAEVHRQGPEANLATVISELERAEQIDCEDAATCLPWPPREFQSTWPNSTRKNWLRIEDPRGWPKH